VCPASITEGIKHGWRAKGCNPFTALEVRARKGCGEAAFDHVIVDICASSIRIEITELFGLLEDRGSMVSPFRIA
jgi:hypothetical protein